MKAYGLRVLKNDESVWSIIAVANSIDKLTPFIITQDNTQFVGSPDRLNSPSIVRYTSENLYPRYMIEEIPYVV
jgi:hypothetical protein